ncbi:hypothetical protein DEU56DRAFT_249334 [Suillus clintonianus]|uniref:uncharacterized protein n=1 Tax=Suillus clintonianus TaxID=1904413 RepID=UPI001B85C352|nr:uncharacterized protein DEU56DRAFT_249334 [Suillus clintonianus]KAG2110099.1 hypothetical protein DEU56DRAFT_249334 [Suillus clintonianus]
MHSLQNARSIAIGALACRKRAFGVFADAVNINSDTGSTRSQSKDQSQSLESGKDERRSKETAQGQQGRQGQRETLSHVLGRRRESSRSHANSSHAAEKHADAKTTSSSVKTEPFIREITKKIDSAVERTINPSTRTPHHVASDAGASRRRKKERQLRNRKEQGKADVGDAGARPAVESARASLAGFDMKRTELLELLLGPPGEISRVAKEGWTTGWGEDGALSMKTL